MVALLAVFLSARNTAAQGCGCERQVNPCAAYSAAPAVFVGRVEAITRTATNRVVIFSVLEGFQGTASSKVEVATAPAGQKCGVPFRVNHEYVVYAFKSESSGRLTTTTCSRTREIDDAAADLTYLRSLKDGTAPPGRITGQVLLGRRDLARRPVGVPQPLPDVIVRVTKDGATETTVSNQAGDFALESRGPGSYVVSVDVPGRYYSEAPPVRIDLRDARSCAEVNPVLFDNGNVSGRVVDAGGRPIAGLTVEVTTLTGTDPRKATTDRDGRYDLTRLPSGRFLIGIGIDASSSRKAAARQPRVFHPGVEKSAAATRVALVAGEHLTLNDLRVPSRFRYLPVSGAVFETDGTPVEGARVYLKGLVEDEADYILAEPVISDGSGRFVIAALEGGDYRLFAERGRTSDRGQRVDSSDQVRLTIVESMKPLRLTLQRRY
jgi:hypothetical protein